MTYKEFIKTKEFKGSQVAWHTGQFMYWPISDIETQDWLVDRGDRILSLIIRTKKGKYHYFGKNTMCVDCDEYIQEDTDRIVIRDLLEMRYNAKKEKKFKVADYIRDYLREKYTIEINDN